MQKSINFIEKELSPQDCLGGVIGRVLSCHAVDLGSNPHPGSFVAIEVAIYYFGNS